MKVRGKCFFVLFFTVAYVKSIFGVHFQGVITSDHRVAFGNQLSVQPGLRSSNIFENFLSQYLFVVSGLPKKKLSNYCRILSRELKELDFKYTKRLSKHMRELSRMGRGELQAELASYVAEVAKQLTFRKQFLAAMNDVFTSQHALVFTDHIYALVDYGNDVQLFIQDDTRKILRTIIEAVMSISKKDRDDLELKLKKSIKEYFKNN